MPLNKLLTIPGKGSERDTPELTRLPLVNDSRKRRLRHALTLICRDEFTKDGSVPNKSIINATDRKMKYGWRGPILVVAQSISRASDPPYEDVTLHDFRDIIDYFLTYNGGPTSQMRVQIVKKTQAIRIHCPAHMVASKVAKFSIEKINTIHPVYSNRPLIDSITSKINLPLCILRIPPDLKWSSKKEDFVNHTAACLALDGSDPESHFDNWYKEGGDALVARADSHHLLPEHLEVLADFCETKVYLLLADAMNTPNYLENINSVFMEHVTEEKFTLYWETYRRKKAISDPRWRNVSSPYY
ncbi:hypothetical protein MMC18_000667 [Xylographa bjoerkii]|nr:hypothetical protein [Xylographa bjoerkii]